MKKIRFDCFDDLKKVITILEGHNIEFTWDIFDKQHVLHLGHVNVDHVKLALENCHVPYRIIDY